MTLSDSGLNLKTHHHHHHHHYTRYPLIRHIDITRSNRVTGVLKDCKECNTDFSCLLEMHRIKKFFGMKQNFGDDTTEDTNSPNTHGINKSETKSETKPEDNDPSFSISSDVVQKSHVPPGERSKKAVMTLQEVRAEIREQVIREREEQRHKPIPLFPDNYLPPRSLEERVADNVPREKVKFTEPPDCDYCKPVIVGTSYAMAAYIFYMVKRDFNRTNAWKTKWRYIEASLFATAFIVISTCYAFDIHILGQTGIEIDSWYYAKFLGANDQQKSTDGQVSTDAGTKP